MFRTIWRCAASLLAVCVLLLDAGAGLAVEHTTAAVSSPQQLQGMFVSDDERFPFALLFEAQTPDLYLVRGLGRIAYSADDPTELTIEMQGLCRPSNQFTIRGTLQVRPDGKRMTEPQAFPWVGRYEPSSDELQLQVSPKHVVGAVRPYATAAKKGQNPQAAGKAASDAGLDFMRLIAFVTAMHAEYGPTVGPGESTPPATSGNTPPASNGNRSGTSSPRATTNDSSQVHSLMADYIENLRIVTNESGFRFFGMGTSPFLQPMRQSTAAGRTATSSNLTESTTTPETPSGSPVDPPMQRSVEGPQPTDVVGRSLDQALTTLWGRGLNPDSFVNLGPPPDPSQAEMVTGITVLPDGRIQVRYYNSTPRDAADSATPRVQGGANPLSGDSGGHTTSTPAADSTAGPTGFQIGDLAALLEGADRAQERIVKGGQAIGGVLNRASGSTSVSISSLSIPEVAPDLQTHQQIWLNTDLRNGPGVTHTVRAQSASPNEGVLDYDWRFTGGSGRDGSTYNHYFIYRDFVIFYNSHDRLTPDLGRPWPTFLDNARQLIDRRFPPQLLGESGGTP